MIETIVTTGNKFFNIVGWFMVAHILYEKQLKSKNPSNWKLFLVIIFINN